MQEIMPFILKVLDSGDFKCQFEASWAVANLALGGTLKQVLCLLEENAIPILCAALAHSNVDLLNNILETLHTLLNAVSSCCPERFDEVRNSVEENGGLYRMERLQESESDKVYHTACRIITVFFDDEVNEEESKSSEENHLMDYSF
ncbi:hypothetical protein KIN20_008791 [Parelaphostrongylus tenuis]|uniref:Uncharacterized protein n=1 Tax=Parelaphostrongylus tenuis TaxID=148309 RepID=A0AAD5MA86_PARTN|nr:hypothetical protein KIN20_008791 [Parelaphostrongylus tenuis]